MRFSECVKKPGDVARRESDGAIAVLQSCESTCVPYSVLHLSGGFDCSASIQGVDSKGEDWTPLAPQVRLEELQRHACAYDGYSYSMVMAEYGAYVRYSDLESVALVREDTERIKQLREHVERNANLVSDCLNVVPGGVTNCMPLERVPEEITERVAKLQRDLEAAEDRAEALEQERDELKKDNATLRNRLDLITDAIACGLEQTTLPQDDDEAHAWVENQVRKLRDERDNLQRKYDRACRELAERFVEDAGGLENLTAMVKEWGNAVQSFMNAPASTATTPCEAIKEVAERVRERIGDPMADNLVNLATHIDTELTTLRTQLASKYVLGEPLTGEQWKSLSDDDTILWKFGGKCSIQRKTALAGPGNTRHEVGKYYHVPGFVWPTLPEPEEGTQTTEPLLPSKEDNPNGLHHRYRISKADGTMCDPRAIYFVLRLDSHGSDPAHIEACRLAARTYADEIWCNDNAKHLHKLSHDLIKLLERLEGEPEEVPSVPKWQGAVEYDTISHGKSIGVTARIGTKGLTAIDCETGCSYTAPFHYFTLYTKPVRHPDGTIAPIEPSPELVAALEGAKDE